MSLIEYKKLGDIVNFKRGYDLPTQDRTEGSYPILSSSGISGYHSEYKVKGEGVIIGRYGTLGEPYYVNEKYWPHNTTLYVTDFKGNSPKYVYYLLKCLGKIKTSDKSAVPGVNRNELHEMVVPCVIQSHQKKIAAVLSALDAKIDVNNRINAELEKLAKTIYDYWFVQFDFPNEDGKPYKASGGKMVYNDQLKRPIPAAWEVKELREIEENIITGKTPPKSKPEYFGGNIPFITIGDIRGSIHIINAEEKLTQEGANFQHSKYLEKGSICVSCIATPGLIGFATEKSQTNQQINSITCQKIENKYYLFFALKNYFYHSRAKTGNTFANMSKSDFSAIEIVYPNEQILIDFAYKVKHLIEEVYVLSKQNQQLTQLRDWLLPLLMNGQVRVE